VVWTIDEPKSKNALRLDTMQALLDAAREAERDPQLRAAIVTGAGDAFVSGGDLRELRDKAGVADAERLTDLGWQLTRTLAELPFPVIASLPGPAIGGGAELAVACDMRVADARARIAFKQVRMGVSSAWGTVPRLVALVGPGRCARLLYTACEMTAAEAKMAGLVDEVTPDGGAWPLSLAWADELIAASPAAVAEMKALVRGAIEATAEQRADERRRFVATWTGKDHEEAVRAWFERRVPVWTPRQ
jgi:enoyl-CoA hydratase/carnithine racemase